MINVKVLVEIGCAPWQRGLRYLKLSCATIIAVLALYTCNINIKRNMKCNDDATTAGESEDETLSTISSANSRWCEAAT